MADDTEFVPRVRWNGTDLSGYGVKIQLLQMPLWYILDVLPPMM
jgi:hypothetical protein